MVLDGLTTGYEAGELDTKVWRLINREDAKPLYLESIEHQR